MGIYFNNGFILKFQERGAIESLLFFFLAKSKVSLLTSKGYVEI
jgi:hypothetical protein